MVMWGVIRMILPLLGEKAADQNLTTLISAIDRYEDIAMAMIS